MSFLPPPAWAVLCQSQSELGAAALEPVQAASDKAAGPRRPKIGCVSWNFHTLAPGGTPEEAIDIIGSLGFDGVELIANSRRT